MCGPKVLRPDLALNRLAVEKLNHPKMAEKTSHLGSPTNDVPSFPRHLRSLLCCLDEKRVFQQPLAISLTKRQMSAKHLWFRC
jgi:hypothetical protein